jgi:PAS domain S-box-containing protein
VHRLERTEAGVKRLIGIERDVTARKEAEQERRMLAAAVEHASEAVLITEAKPLDHPGPRIVYANPAFESMTGYETDEVIGLTPRILQGPDTDPEVLREFRTRLENEQPFWAETVNYRKDGTTYMVHWDVAPVYNNSGELEYWVSVQHDVTEERRREEELRAAKEEAEKAARLKEAMLANMSHEVRTPLTSMMGFAQILTNELEGAQARHAAIIHESGKRLQKTLESMLQLSELHGGAYEPSWERADLREVAAEVVETMRPRAATEDLTLEVAYPGRPVNARIDLIATQRIITNLLDNAIKFTPAEGKVTLQVDQEDAVPFVCVEDTGIGIAEEAIDEMFVAFKQESEGLSRSYEGSGLGLAIVKQLVEETGGVITVESTKGEGTRIQVRFPETASQDVKTLDGVDSV